METAGHRLLRDVEEVIHRRVVGQDATIQGLLIALLTGGHVLLDGLPGLAKTLLVRSLADALHTSFRRIQFTPDLLPGDVVGTPVYNQGTGEFQVYKGPVFAHLLLADEVNRAPPKVQSALLGGDGGGAGDDRRNDVPSSLSVHGCRHPESDRAAGHLPARGGRSSTDSC